MHSPRFLALLDELKQLHVDKSAGYAGAQNVDPWANFRTATDWGVEPWRGALVRFGDKYTRLKNILSNPDNERFGESVHDQAMDMAAYAIIFLCLYEEDPGLPENRMYQPLDKTWDPKQYGYPDNVVLCRHDGEEDASDCRYVDMSLTDFLLTEDLG